MDRIEGQRTLSETATRVGDGAGFFLHAALRGRSRGGKNFCAVLRKSTCATRKSGWATKLFSVPPKVRQMPSPLHVRAIVRHVRCRAARMHRGSKPQKTSVFLFAPNACACIARVLWRNRACTNRVARETRRRPGRKKDCVRLLTVEKTVIRFRPSRHPLRTRVSIKIATTRSTTRTSARTIDTVDAGALSSAKTFKAKSSSAKSPTTSFFTKPAAPGVAGFLLPGPARRACRIRPGAPCAPAVDRGSNSRGVASNWAVLAK
jgi:hypothetical protein